MGSTKVSTAEIVDMLMRPTDTASWSLGFVDTQSVKIGHATRPLDALDLSFAEWIQTEKHRIE